jgi:hypothetical protein
MPSCTRDASLHCPVLLCEAIVCLVPCGGTVSTLGVEEMDYDIEDVHTEGAELIIYDVMLHS